MTGMLFQIVGGIGLFLLGMVLLTDGIKSYAGDALRRALLRFTGRPLRAFVSGVLVTALVQSSSATTVAVIGFVSAGLITFAQAVGVVMGASLGTTTTGWIVSVLGLKVNVGLYALPLVGIGVFARLLGRGRWPALGLALAGFGLIFVGIQTLQDGMSVVAPRFQLAALPRAGFVQHLLIILFGAAMTVVMQSSSAAMATTLTALHTNSINFEQATLLVIGASIGTTVTGALAAIGANMPAKRTALAHVLFNLATGIVAAVLLPFFLWAIGEAQVHFGLEPGAVSLAAFHTSFIFVGVLLFLPFVGKFARWIERLLPDAQNRLTQHLDNSLLSVPTVALEATRRALGDIACEMFRTIHNCLADNEVQPSEFRRVEIRQALSDTQLFLTRIPPLGEDEPMARSRESQVHAIDHLLRLQSRLKAPTALVENINDERLRPEVGRCRDLLRAAIDGLQGVATGNWRETLRDASQQLAARRRDDRPVVLRQTAHGTWDPAHALDLLDAMRWLDRVGYHTWRACEHLAQGEQPQTATSAETTADNAAPPDTEGS